MRHRHTFFLDPSKQPALDAFEIIPGNKKEPAGLKVRNLHAAREWKITIDSEDHSPERAKDLGKEPLTVQFVKDTAKNLPEPLQRGFVQGFHVLWRGTSNHVAELPFVGSLLPSSTPEPILLPGRLSYLHVDHPSSTTMDSLFETLWSFITPDNDLSPGTDGFLQLASLVHADVIEFDILSSESLQIRALWSKPIHDNGWRLDIPAQEDTRVEVGIFEEGSGEDKDEMALGGLRAILGEDKDFQPTLFTFPHRHHILPSSGNVETSLDPAFGSHPVLKTILPMPTLQAPINDTLDHETCNLHALYTLSKDVFVDQYQLSQLAQFKSAGIEDLRGVWGETDLENPSYKTKAWGSVVLVDIPKVEKLAELTLELPLHMRYLEPQDGGGKTPVEVLPPEVFWTCENTVEDFTLSPFGPPSRSVLHTLFPADVVFYHITKQVTHTDDGALSIQVPVADLSQMQFVQNMTVLGILIGFTYLFVKGVRVGIKGLRWRGKGKEKAKEL